MKLHYSTKLLNITAAVFCLLTTTLLFWEVAAAAEPQAILVSWQQGEIVTTSKIYCLQAKAGSVRRVDGSIIFTPFSITIKDLKKKKAKVAKINRLKSLQSAGTNACRALANQQATPTPTPTISAGNFDRFGNATTAGKALFAIPLNLTANVTAGKNLHQAYCSGCHEERQNYTFGQLRPAIKASPMLYDEQQIPDDYLANITAYLNRFRLN